MINAASVSAAFSTLSTDVGTNLITVIGILLLGVGALLVLGFAVRKLKSKVTGKKF